MTQITQAILDAYLKAYNDVRDGVPGRHREAHIAGLEAAFQAAPEVQPIACAREPSDSARALIDGGFKRAFTYGAEWASANPIHADMDAQREMAANRFISSFYQPAREPVSDDPIGNPVGPDVDASGLVNVRHSHDYIVETIGQCFARAEMPEEFSPNTLRKSAFLIGDLADRLTTEKAALAAAVSSRDGAVREATRLQHLLSDLQGQHEALKADAAAQPAAQEPATAGVAEREGEIEELAKHLHEERGYDRYRTWPTHADDEGYRGNGRHVTITPPDVQARLREESGRILIRVDQLRRATLTPAAPKTPDADTGGEDEPEADLPRIDRIERQMLQHGGVDSVDMEWMAAMTRTAIAPAATGGSVGDGGLRGLLADACVALEVHAELQTGALRERIDAVLAQPAPVGEDETGVYRDALEHIRTCRARSAASGFPIGVEPDAAGYMQRYAENALDRGARTAPPNRPRPRRRQGWGSPA